MFKYMKIAINLRKVEIIYDKWQYLLISGKKYSAYNLKKEY